MADDKAGVQNNPNPQDNEENPDKPAARSYTQEEVDRIADKVRRNAKRDAELRVRREVQSAPAPSVEKKDPPEEPKPAQEPKRDDFDTHEEYTRALTRFDAAAVAREEADKREQKTREDEHKKAGEKAAQEWHAKIAKAEAKHDDFRDVLEDNAETFDLIYGSPMRSAITESDIGPEIVYHLCSTEEGRAEAKRIAGLKGYKQAAEIAKIEEKLEAAAKPAPKDGEDDPDKGGDDDEDPRWGGRHPRAQPRRHLQDRQKRDPEGRSWTSPSNRWARAAATPAPSRPTRTMPRPGAASASLNSRAGVTQRGNKTRAIAPP
jgi:hypothetical protein